MIEWYKLDQSEGCQGSLLLTAASEVQLGVGRSHSFSITTDGVQLVLAARNDREILDWLDCVRTQLDVLREPQRPLSPVPAEHRQSFMDDDDDDGDDDSWDSQGGVAKSFSEV